MKKARWSYILPMSLHQRRTLFYKILSLRKDRQDNQITAINMLSIINCESPKTVILEISVAKMHHNYQYGIKSWQCLMLNVDQR